VHAGLIARGGYGGREPKPERAEPSVTKGDPMQGTMLWFNETEDFGFISSEDGERVLVQGSAFVGGSRPKGRCAGRVVTFGLNVDEGGPKAEAVVFVPEAAPRRARLRHRGGRMA
jgi:cold shock CspA family protein